MFLNSRRTVVVVPADLGHAHDYNPNTFPLARMKKENTLTVGRLYISASLNEILMIRQLIQNPVEFKRIFEDVEQQCHR